MPVHLDTSDMRHPLGYRHSASVMLAKLLGKEWPTEEICAFWSLVPGQYRVQWDERWGRFEISRGDTPSSVMGRFVISAEEAPRLEVWQRVFSELEMALQKPRARDTLSLQNIDQLTLADSQGT